MEEAFGILPLRQEQGQWQVFLIQNWTGNYWGFPKGRAAPGETARESASRELEEETGLIVDSFLPFEPFIEKYQQMVEGKPLEKVVHYFAALVTGTVVLQTGEIQAGKWVPLEEAPGLLTYEQSRLFCTSLLKLL
jgi:8-oxo-dGTP pyrophosphatase MutT (NUDIX family)